jgi:uncharacterized protein (TIGR03435 family)
MIRLVRVLLAGFATFAIAHSQSAFEVVSVKPAGRVPEGRASTGPGGAGTGCDGGFPRLDGRRFTVTTTPYALITWAYGYNKTWGCSYVTWGDLLTGGPSWIRTERYEIQALIPADAPSYNLDQFMKGEAPGLEKMLQAMLADRMKLVVHQVKKDAPVYALTQARGGAKLARPSEEDRRQFGTRRQANARGQTSNMIVGKKVEIRDLAFLLLLAVRLPVIDRTGLTGEFNFDLEFAPLESDSFVDSSSPSLFTALQEQLGLRLERTKAPLDALVIDSAELPSEN